MNDRRHAQQGFTVLELAVAVGALSFVVVVVGSFLTSSHAVVSETTVGIRVTSELRRGLEAVTNVIREIDIDTLSGFDAERHSENPTFRRVVGADLDERLYGEVEELRWIPSPHAVGGVEQPGAVFLVTSAGQKLLADRVPRGGFQLRQDGTTIAVFLTTYWATGGGRAELTSGKTAIRMRN